MLNDDLERGKREGRQQAFAEVLAWTLTTKELFGKNASPVTRETVVQLLGGLEGFARDEATEQVALGELLAEETHVLQTGRVDHPTYGVLVRIKSVGGSIVACADEDQAKELAVLLSTARRRR